MPKITKSDKLMELVDLVSNCHTNMIIRKIMSHPGTDHPDLKSREDLYWQARDKLLVMVNSLDKEQSTTAMIE